MTLSADYRATLARRLGPLFRPPRTAVVPTGIDLSPYAGDRRAAALGGTVRIGMAGRFSPTKAQQVLVSAPARLVVEYPDRDWLLSLAGDGTCLAAVSAAVSAAGLSDRVEMSGYIAPDQLPDWFASLDLYAHASDGETLSTSLLQAMAAGVPIVASDVAGISDLLGPPRLGAGRLVPARDVDAFTAALAADTGELDTAIARATRARAHVRECHSVEAMRAGYASLLEKVGR